jgi:ribosomal-protein-alanine N-acetyltransferase
VSDGPAAAPAAVELRPMRWWDIEALLPLEEQLFAPTAWTAAMFWSELAHPQTRCYLVAELAGRPVGYAGVLTAGSDGDVQTIAVAPGAQGRGVGARLLAALLERCAEAGCAQVMLEVRADNEAAIRLYRRHGFERLAVRRGYYQPGGVDAWIMRLRPVRLVPPERGSGTP